MMSTTVVRLLVLIVALDVSWGSLESLLALQPRILGGYEVQDRCKPPYSSMVALGYQDETGPYIFCSAVLINSNTLLTSGLCGSQVSILRQLVSVVAVVGERDMYMTDLNEQRLTIESYKIHPLFNESTFDNNIALLRLSSSVTYSTCVKPALSIEDDPTACMDVDDSCLVAGWGPYAEGSNTNSRILRYTSVTVVEENVSRLLPYARPVGSLFGETPKLKGQVCYFDWGSFVSCIRNGRYVLRGVVGDHNCKTEKPVPFAITNVVKYQSWMDGCMQNWAAC